MNPEKINNDLKNLANNAGLDLYGEEFANYLDKIDKLSKFRQQFCIPTLNQQSESVYLCGNSLGLQPKAAKENVNKVLENWSLNGSNSHFAGYLPAGLCENEVVDDLAVLVGAFSDEVAVMNGLSVNLHLLLVSFYQPTPKRHKILIEKGAFPSDHYIAESQIRQRGYDPKTSLILISNKQDEDYISMDEVCQLIEDEGDEIALILLPGVQYYSGQVFDMKRITEVGHLKGCKVGFDLAHAVGNISLRLHDWNVDFACWCSYKYLNSGAGAIAGAFMHRKHEDNNFHKFTGWWGHKMETRFNMDNKMDLQRGISGYYLSNNPPLLVACLRASLDIFKQTTITELQNKSSQLNSYLELLLDFDEQFRFLFQIITPKHERGCQLSIKFQNSVNIKEVHEKLEENRIICDVRKPSVIRIALVPLYNTFNDAFYFVNTLKKIILDMKQS